MLSQSAAAGCQGVSELKVGDAAKHRIEAQKDERFYTDSATYTLVNRDLDSLQKQLTEILNNEQA
jgi:guanylate kinase